MSPATHNSTHDHLPRTVAASLDARLAPFHSPMTRPALEELDVEVSRSVAPREERLQRLSLLKDLKLLFAALGAGGRVVPLGDNSRTAHLLAQYAATLREH
jgi:hypothetical protein